MKKLFLTSLLAVAAVSGAHAANVIDGNPLYMPSAGHFYSVSTLASHSEANKYWILDEQFGYGISDKLEINVATSLSENDSFDVYGCDNVALELVYRAYDKGGIVADFYGGVAVGDAFGGLYMHDKKTDTTHWMDKDFTNYAWTAGARLGYTTGAFTIAGYTTFNYVNSEMFNWNEKAGEQGTHTLSLGLDGQFVIDSNWNLIAGVEYTGRLDNYERGEKLMGKVENAGVWSGYFGVNYNIDATKYVGAYINGSMNHQGGDDHDQWVGDKGYGYGIQFGIDF